MIIKHILLIIFTFFILSPLKSHAVNLDQEYLKNFVHDFVAENLDKPEEGQMQITVSNIDNRINIQPCSVPLQANIPENHNSRNLNVKIICQEPNKWQLFIPVKVAILAPVLVATTTISKGMVLDSHNTEVKMLSLHRLRGSYLQNAERVLGAKATRRTNKGSVISPRHVCIVCKGDNVTIVAKSNGLMIKTEGLALKNGSIGEQIAVENLRSKRKVLARVDTINQVIINL